MLLTGVAVVSSVVSSGCRGEFNPDLSFDSSGSETDDTTDASTETGVEDPCPNDAEIAVGGRCMGPLATIEGATGPRDLALAELSGDGAVDLLVADGAAVNFHLGGAQFGGAVPLMGLAAIGLGVGDLDGVGGLDFVSVSPNEANVRLAAGGGAFTLGDSLAISDGWDAILVDVDGDTDEDVVVSAGGVRVFLNDGGAFVAGDQQTLAGTQGIAAGDFDGDGALDLAVAATNSNQVAVYENDGAGAFTLATMFSVSLVYDVATVDVDGDGAPEILAVDGNDGNVAVLTVTSNFLVEQRSLHAVGRVPHRIAVGDIDGDGFADAVTANNMSGDVSVLLGDGDSFVEEARLVAVPETVAAEAIAVADVSGGAGLEILVAGAAGKIVVYGDGT